MLCNPPGLWNVQPPSSYFLLFLIFHSPILLDPLIDPSLRFAPKSRRNPRIKEIIFIFNQRRGSNVRKSISALSNFASLCVWFFFASCSIPQTNNSSPTLTRSSSSNFLYPTRIFMETWQLRNFWRLIK